MNSNRRIWWLKVLVLALGMFLPSVAMAAQAAGAAAAAAANQGLTLDLTGAAR